MARAPAKVASPKDSGHTGLAAGTGLHAPKRSSTSARALGAGKRDVADALARHTFVLALRLAAAFSTVLLLGAPSIFRWMGGRGEMLSAGLAYANVAFAGAVSICMLNLLGSAVRGTGNMGLPAGVIVGSVIGHVLISPVLIFGWGRCRPWAPPAPAGAHNTVRWRQPGVARLPALVPLARDFTGANRG